MQVDINHDLICLHGRHRIEAAKKYLHPDDKWWVVDLYSDANVPFALTPTVLMLALDLGEREIEELREEYSNAKSLTGTYSAIFGGLIWLATRSPRQDGYLNYQPQKSEMSVSWGRRRPRILRLNIYNVPSMTYSRLPVCVQPNRLVHFIGYSHCDVLR